MAKLNWHWLSLSQTCQNLKSGQASAYAADTRDVGARTGAGESNLLLCKSLADEASSSSPGIGSKTGRRRAPGLTSWCAHWYQGPALYAGGAHRVRNPGDERLSSTLLGDGGESPA